MSNWRQILHFIPYLSVNPQQINEYGGYYLHQEVMFLDTFICLSVGACDYSKGRQEESIK